MTGNLCPRICKALLSQFSCLKHAEGGKVVILFTEGNERMVLKTKTLNILKYPSTSEIEAYRTIEELRSTFRTLLENSFTQENAIDQFLSNAFIDRSSVKASLATATYLLDQPEYVTQLQLQNTYTVPTLHGVCGPFYVTDYTPTDDILLVNSMWNGLPWSSSGL